MGLGDDQKDFIEKRVKELGSVEEVTNFYTPDCAVWDYAVKMAKKLKLPELHPEDLPKFVLPPQAGRELLSPHRPRILTPTNSQNGTNKISKKKPKKTPEKTRKTQIVENEVGQDLYKDAINKIVEKGE